MSDICLNAAERATDRVEKAFYQKELQQDPNSGAVFNGISENQTSFDDADGSIYHVVYAFNDECLAGVKVKTHQSDDGLTCTANDSDVEDEGQPDCG